MYMYYVYIYIPYTGSIPSALTPNYIRVLQNPHNATSCAWNQPVATRLSVGMEWSIPFLCRSSPQRHEENGIISHLPGVLKIYQRFWLPFPNSINLRRCWRWAIDIVPIPKSWWTRPRPTSTKPRSTAVASTAKGLTKRIWRNGLDGLPDSSEENLGTW